MIRLHVFWGNYDAESKLYLREQDFQAILKGKPLSKKATGFYEGQSFTVWWSIKNKQVSVSGPDGMDCWKGSLREVRAFDAEGEAIDMTAHPLLATESIDHGGKNPEAPSS